MRLDPTLPPAATNSDWLPMASVPAVAVTPAAPAVTVLTVTVPPFDVMLRAPPKLVAASLRSSRLPPPKITALPEVPRALVAAATKFPELSVNPPA